MAIEQDELVLRVTLDDQASAGLWQLRQQAANLGTGPSAAGFARMQQQSAHAASGIHGITSQLTQMMNVGGVAGQVLTGVFREMGAEVEKFGKEVLNRIFNLKEGTDRLVEMGQAAEEAATHTAQLRKNIATFAQSGIDTKTAVKNLQGFTSTLADLQLVNSETMQKLLAGANEFGQAEQIRAFATKIATSTQQEALNETKRYAAGLRDYYRDVVKQPELAATAQRNFLRIMRAEQLAHVRGNFTESTKEELAVMDRRLKLGEQIQKQQSRISTATDGTIDGLQGIFTRLVPIKDIFELIAVVAEQVEQTILSIERGLQKSTGLEKLAKVALVLNPAAWPALMAGVVGSSAPEKTDEHGTAHKAVPPGLQPYQRASDVLGGGGAPTSGGAQHFGNPLEHVAAITGLINAGRFSSAVQGWKESTNIEDRRNQPGVPWYKQAYQSIKESAVEVGRDLGFESLRAQVVPAPPGAGGRLAAAAGLHDIESGGQSTQMAGMQPLGFLDSQQKQGFIAEFIKSHFGGARQTMDASKPTVPGMWSEEDEFRQQIARKNEVATAWNMAGWGALGAARAHGMGLVRNFLVPESAPGALRKAGDAAEAAEPSAPLPTVMELNARRGQWRQAGLSAAGEESTRGVEPLEHHGRLVEAETEQLDELTKEVKQLNDWFAIQNAANLKAGGIALGGAGGGVGGALAGGALTGGAGGAGFGGTGAGAGAGAGTGAGAGAGAEAGAGAGAGAGADAGGTGTGTAPGGPVTGPAPGGGIGGPATAAPTTAGGSAFLAQKRAGFAEQLKDPETRKFLGAVLSSENVGAGPAVVESLFNRTEFLNEQRARQGKAPLSLMQMMKGGFYGPVKRGEIGGHLRKMNDPAYAARMNNLIDQALGGSNVIQSNTDQGSKGDPNYEKGGIGVNINKERFNDWGVPGSAAWRQRRQAEIASAGNVASTRGVEPQSDASGGAGTGAGEGAAGGTRAVEGAAGGGDYQSIMSWLRARGGHDARSSNQPGGLSPEFASRLATAGKAYEAATGRKANFGEMFRDRARQAEYYARYRSGRGGLAAPPGLSRHERGTATDIPRGGFLDWMHKNAGQHGLEFLKGRAFAADPVHVQLAGQGGAQAPIGGGMGTGAGEGAAGSGMGRAPGGSMGGMPGMPGMGGFPGMGGGIPGFDMLAQFLPGPLRGLLPMLMGGMGGGAGMGGGIFSMFGNLFGGMGQQASAQASPAGRPQAPSSPPAPRSQPAQRPQRPPSPRLASRQQTVNDRPTMPANVAPTNVPAHLRSEIGPLQSETVQADTRLPEGVGGRVPDIDVWDASAGQVRPGGRVPDIDVWDASARQRRRDISVWDESAGGRRPDIDVWDESAGRRPGEVAPYGETGVAGGYGVDRNSLFRNGNRNSVDVNGTGTINVNVRAPNGTSVDAAAGGLFNKTVVQRANSQMVHADSGPHVPAGLED